MNHKPQLAEQAAAYRIARRDLMEIHGLGEDDQVLLDSLDGLTDCMDQMVSMLRRAREMETWVVANEVAIEALRVRNASLKGRVRKLRSIVVYYLGYLNRKKVEAHDFSYTLANGRQSLIGDCDPNELPDKFVRIKREPDRIAIFKALKDGEIVPGYSISNGAPHLRSL
jgi:hypothetical protein